ncbi:hypothetical protein ACRRTK_021117 [Alexandromys fortis]
MRLYVRRESIGNLDLMKQKNNCRKVTKFLVMNEENRKAEKMEEQEGDERVKENKKFLIMSEPIRVLVTGAAGQIAYSLLYSIGNGSVFGKDQPIFLVLLDITPMMGVLDGVLMELQDCALPLLKDIIATDKMRSVDPQVVAHMEDKRQLSVSQAYPSTIFPEFLTAAAMQGVTGIDAMSVTMAVELRPAGAAQTLPGLPVHARHEKVAVWTLLT